MSLLPGSTRAVLARAAILTGLIALLDWRIDLNLSFGFLYLFPMLLVGTVLGRWQVLAAAVFCTLLSDLFDPYPFTLAVSVPQDILIFTALAGSGLFTHEVTRRRRRELETLRMVQAEAAARREAEEQLEFLIESSPAAIVTMSADCCVLRANLAAHRLLGVEQGRLLGVNIRRYIPALGRVPAAGDSGQTFRTEMQCRGERENHDVFLANVFFSTYNTAVGRRLAALIVDASEELREREEASLEQLMAGSRILVGAVSHEVRNVCGAIAIVHENLVRTGQLKGNQDFEALGALVETLHRIASLELKQSAGQSPAEVIEVRETLDDLRIVLEPYCQEHDIELRWDIADPLPHVWGERHSLLLVLLNLVKNSARALAEVENRRINISVRQEHAGVSIRVADNGPGLGSTDKLFQPFQKGAESTGLGLYLSRAFVRSFRGELRHEPVVLGCCFVIDLAAAGEPSQTVHHGSHPTLIAR